MGKIEGQRFFGINDDKTVKENEKAAEHAKQDERVSDQTNEHLNDGKINEDIALEATANSIQIGNDEINFGVGKVGGTIDDIATGLTSVSELMSDETTSGLQQISNELDRLSEEDRASAEEIRSQLENLENSLFNPMSVSPDTPAEEQMNYIEEGLKIDMYNQQIEEFNERADVYEGASENAEEDAKIMGFYEQFNTSYDSEHEIGDDSSGDDGFGDDD